MRTLALALQQAIKSSRWQASLDYAQSLLHARDLTEVMRLHSEFIQSQLRSLAEQVGEGRMVSRAAMNAVKPKICKPKICKPKI